MAQKVFRFLVKPVKNLNLDDFLATLTSQAREMFSIDYLWVKIFYVMCCYSIVYGLTNVAGSDFYLANDRFMLGLSILTPLMVLRDKQTFKNHRKIITKILCSGRWLFLVPFSTIFIQHLTSNKILNETAYLKLEPLLFLWVSLVSGYLLLYACYKFTVTFKYYTLAWASFMMLLYHVFHGGS